MFEAIAINGNEDDLAEKLQMTRKQYYTRIAKLLKVSLIKRRHGKYALTSFGKVIYNVQKILSRAMDNRWKFKAIDAMKDNSELSSEDYLRMIDVLLDDNEFKEIIPPKQIGYLNTRN